MGCGGVHLGNNDQLRKYRGLDEKGMEIPNAYCHPRCDLCPQCGQVFEESGENMCILFSRSVTFSDLQ